MEKFKRIALDEGVGMSLILRNDKRSTFSDKKYNKELNINFIIVIDFIESFFILISIKFWQGSGPEKNSI